MKLLAVGLAFVSEVSAVGPFLHGHEMAAVQDLVPIMRWGLERLLRVESSEFGPIWGQRGWPCLLPAVGPESSGAQARMLWTRGRVQSAFGPGT